MTIAVGDTADFQKACKMFAFVFCKMDRERSVSLITIKYFLKNVFELPLLTKWSNTALIQLKTVIWALNNINYKYTRTENEFQHTNFRTQFL